MNRPAEPAIRSYFFGKGYRDLRDTLVGSWNLNLATARDYLSRSGTEWSREQQLMAVLWVSAGISVVVFGTVTFLLASALHVLLLAVVFLLIYVGFTLVLLTERAYLAYQRFFAVCPACHAKAPLPEYFCPKCGEVHRNLVPSSYGILHRTCLCGERLPTTFFLKRGTLQARCPECEHLLHREHTEARKIFLPIMGGPAAGKSAYLHAVVRRLIEHALPTRGINPSFLDKPSEHGYRRIVEALSQGRAPDKTVARLPVAFNLKLEASSGTRLLYLYDPAGEAFLHGGEMILHKYLSYRSGLIFLIDPFSIPRVRRDYHDELETADQRLKPSTLPAEDALARVLLNLEKNFGLGKTQRIQAPVAVVLSKADAFGLRARVGTGTSDAVREQLCRWDQEHVVQRLEARFAQVGYFLCSAFGRMPGADSSAFEPEGVLEPLLWLLEQEDVKFFGRAEESSAGVV